MKAPERTREARARPGLLLHHSLKRFGQGSAYQNHMVTVADYGTKVAGLLILPSAWVPPFAALPAWLSEEWRMNPQRWYHIAKRSGIDIVGSFQAVSQDRKYDIILRSSAVGEDLEDRGRYTSVIISKNALATDIRMALERIYADFVSQNRHHRMGICVQQYVHAELAGHVSNEARLSGTRNQWKYEIELPSYAPDRGLNSKFADPAPERERLSVKGQRGLPTMLRRVCHWLNLRVDARSHIEWCVADDRLWIVQLDQESPTSAGENPHVMPPTHFGDHVSAPRGFTAFHKYRIQDDTAWKKLNNVRDFWVEANPPRHRLFYIPGDEIKPLLGDRGNRRKLSREIDHLTSSRAVLRTDCSDPKVRGFNLPRTHTVSGPEAVSWLGRTLKGMENNGIRSEDIVFILHQYIPARAAAWSYYSPGEALVRVDCLWGLPDGLQFLSHDSFELDARTGDEIAAEVRFKRDFLQEQADGSWRYVSVARQFGRDRVLSAEALRAIALQTVAIAKRLDERAQIMWFCDLPPELGLGQYLPWYRSRDFSTHHKIERPALRARPVHTLLDLESIEKEDGRFILTLQPDANLIRADESFLDRVIEVAVKRNLPVELKGSILGHAYYRLRDEGVIVLTTQPKYIRSRGKKSHRKLVRDAIPANIAAKGELVSFGRLAREEAVKALVGKLFEEGLEVSGARDRDARLEELADVLEVLRGLAALEAVEWADLIVVADEKRRKRGGFEGQTVLLETERPKLVRQDVLGMVGSDGGEPVVSLHKIGLISVSDGGATIPFTRLIDGEEVPLTIPSFAGKISVVLKMAGGALQIFLRPAEDDVTDPGEPDLFPFSE